MLRQHSKSPVSQAKERIQAILRQIAIARDGGCVLRKYPEAGACGGYGPKSGKLILQAEHLNTRARNVSFAEPRNIVCLCSHHHGFWKPQHSRLYWELIEKIIGAERWKWLKRVEADRNCYNFGLYEWLKVELALKQELAQWTSPAKPSPSPAQVKKAI